ncbi:MAG: helix-turn-helix transcriptional regulator [Proteobacteria bacterium]|nr:helix-turn-helix transcriptional regulator [Pseudomonadota bacterium]
MNTSISEKLSLRLKQIGMTQRDLAKEIQMTEATVSRYISGERLPSVETLGKIADALEVDVSYFQDQPNSKVDDIATIHSLIARNEKELTPEEKLSIIRMLSKS